LTASDAASIIIFKQMFVYDTESRKGNGTMSENELELIKIIRESEDPAKAMITAIEIIRDYINVKLV
jgi:hypothetical protein